MDLSRYSGYALPVQSDGEWKHILEFVEAYFRNRGIERPVVVELGVQSNCQKAYWEDLVGAEHIGIDFSDKYSTPDILGDLFCSNTIAALQERLKGRPVNLVWMDALTTIDGINRQFDLWEPMATHIVAINNIFSTDAHPVGAKELWKRLVATRYRDYRFVTFYDWISEERGLLNKYQIGTGLLLKVR